MSIRKIKYTLKVCQTWSQDQNLQRLPHTYKACGLHHLCLRFKACLELHESLHGFSHRHPNFKKTVSQGFLPFYSYINSIQAPTVTVVKGLKILYTNTTEFNNTVCICNQKNKSLNRVLKNAYPFKIF